MCLHHVCPNINPLSGTKGARKNGSYCVANKLPAHIDYFCASQLSNIQYSYYPKLLPLSPNSYDTIYTQSTSYHLYNIDMPSNWPPKKLVTRTVAPANTVYKFKYPTGIEPDKGKGKATDKSKVCVLRTMYTSFVLSLI